MKTYLVYDPTTGEVSGSHRTDSPEVIEANFTDAGIPMLAIPDGEDPFDYYVEDGAAFKRVPITYTLTTDGLEASISGLPAGTEVAIEGQTFEVSVITVTLEFDIPGTYHAELTNPDPRYLPTTVEITL